MGCTMLRRLAVPPLDLLTPHLPPRAVAAAEVRHEVEQIIADVTARGDVALVEHTTRVDGVTLTPAEWEVPRDGWADAFERLPPLLQGAPAEATRRVKDY